MKKVKILFAVIVFTALFSAVLTFSSSADSRFTDLPENFWAEDSICFCYYHGAFYSQSTLFYPYGGLRRDIAVDGIRRMLDISVPKYADTPFSDVPYSSDYSGSIKWAYDNNITNGTGNGLFSPDTIITRQEFATLVYRALNVTNATIPVTKPNISFTDQSSIASWSQTAVMTLAKAEIITGKPDGSFDPTGTIDRSSGATMLSKMYAINKYPGNEILFYVRSTSGAPIANATVYIYFENTNAPADKYPEQPIKTNTYGIACLSTSSNLAFAANAFAINYRQGLTNTTLTRNNFINTIEMALGTGGGYSLPIAGFNNMTEWTNTRNYLNGCLNFGWRYGPASQLEYHQGIDIARTIGTSVYSASTGEVVKAGWYNECGNLVQIKTRRYVDPENEDNDEYYYFIYQHLNTYSVSLNNDVTQEQRIGAVGNTGGNYGYHLHFSVSNTDNYGLTSREYMDPLAFIRYQSPYHDYDYNGNPVGG